MDRADKPERPAETIALYTAPGCEHCAAARESLEWRGAAFVEYDVASDREALARLLEITGGRRTVPVVVEPGREAKVGWMGRSCHL